MNIQKTTLSLVAVMALGSQSLLATIPTGADKTDRDSSYTSDFRGNIGFTSAGLANNDCGVAVQGTYQVSEEYLAQNTFSRNINMGIFTLGVTSPGTVSDPTIEILFPSLVNQPTLANWSAYGIRDIDTNTTVLNFSGVDVVNPNLVSFDTASSTDLVNGHRYCITNDPASQTCAQLPIVIPQNTPAGAVTTSQVKWSIFTNSGTSERRDFGILPISTVVVPQFTINCVSKLDGLINWENGRRSFVAHKHGLDAGITSAAGGTDIQNTVVDTLIFTVTNAAGVTSTTNTCDDSLHSFDTWLDGNLTDFDIVATQPAGVADLITADWNTSLTTTRVGVSAGTTTWPSTDTARFTTADEPIFNGSTEYHANYDYSTGYNIANPIVPTTFSGDVALEGTAGARPLASPVSAAMRSNLGEWKDHAYIAQIAGVGHNPHVVSRIFITNRSCKDVTPTFKVIQNGKVQSVTNIGNHKNSNQSIEISVDSQNVYQLKDIVDAAVLADTTNTIKASGVYSIEVVLGGVAEDFYVYAQSKNADNTNTYDLPVYNTSTRD